MEFSQNNSLRYAIIGVAAGIFNAHRPALALPGVQLVAGSDINAAVGKERCQEFGCAFYEDYRVMLNEVHPDVVVILTPPTLHARMAIESLQAGCHVLLEKPMAVEVAEADAMIETAAANNKLLGVIFQQHFRPEIAAAKNLVEEGALGAIQRVDVIATWPRPDSYFALASWRATWVGEGGGVLINQASHNFDTLCYLLGQPNRIVAWTRRLLHQIETEDTAHALLEWSNGILGYVHVTTAEVDIDESIKIVGTAGSLEITPGKIVASRLDQDLREYRTTCQDPFGKPAAHPYEVQLEPGRGDHASVYRGFYNAIVSGSPYYADGVQARMELELVNAITYSSYRHCEVALPLDRQAYATLLEELRQQSKK